MPTPYRPPHQQNPQETRNLMMALLVSMMVLGGWQYFYERPREQQEQAFLHQQQQKKQAASDVASPAAGAPPMQTAAGAPALTRDQALKGGERLAIDSPQLKGSISLAGGRLDDLTLTRYRDTVDPASPNVVLLAPRSTQAGYFADLGWASADTAVPDSSTPYQAAGRSLTPGAPVTLSWQNADKVTFEMTYALDDQFMFTVTQKVTNNGTKPVTLAPYGLLNRELDQEAKHFAILHEGPLGVINGAIEESEYKKLREDGDATYDTSPGWLGITDKYWLTALIPVTTDHYTARFRHMSDGAAQRYQADYTGKPVTVAPGASAVATTHLFAGAKRVDLLEGYEKQLNIPLFSRAVDFGRLYFLTIPIFHLLHFFHGLVGNFGIAILLLTVCIKAALFPLANKSYASMSQMKRVTPKMNELKEKHGNDRLKFNQEVMALYKREKVNPASGCLPALIQIPVFFSLYKVLFVTIEMRQAPFFGWIHDLSAPDPTNLFTLFGLIPWSSQILGYPLHLGIWPMIFAATMVIQQKLNPKPADPTQAQIMAFLPYGFLFLFASFPAGLVIYYCWNNTLSILQQWTITRRFAAKEKRRDPVAA